jgi:hypothetical protein
MHRNLPLDEKIDLCLFHLTLQLLKANNLADLRDFVPDAPLAIDDVVWRTSESAMQEYDADRNGDLNQFEFGNLGDFAAADLDLDGKVTEVELYRYLCGVEKQRRLDKAVFEMNKLLKGLLSYKHQFTELPKALEALWIEPNNFPVGMFWHPILDSPFPLDPWGMPYKLAIDETTTDSTSKSVSVRSNGPDRIERTEDDISSRVEVQ